MSLVSLALAVREERAGAVVAQETWAHSPGVDYSTRRRLAALRRRAYAVADVPQCLYVVELDEALGGAALVYVMRDESSVAAAATARDYAGRAARHLLATLLAERAACAAAHLGARERARRYAAVGDGLRHDVVSEMERDLAATRVTLAASIAALATRGRSLAALEGAAARLADDAAALERGARARRTCWERCVCCVRRACRACGACVPMLCSAIQFTRSGAGRVANVLSSASEMCSAHAIIASSTIARLFGSLLLRVPNRRHVPLDAS